MRRPTLLGLIVFAALDACVRTTAVTEPELVTGGEGVLAVGATLRVSGTDVRIGVEQIADSRCPADVTCVRAGEAVVSLRLSGAGADRRDTLRIGGEPRQTSYGAHEIMLVDVRPYPRTTDTERKPSAVLRVERMR